MWRMYLPRLAAGLSAMEIALLLTPVVLALVAKLAGLLIKPPDPGPAPELYEPPTFKVVALGTAGSGKTVLLSTLFHTLNFQAPERSYYLETDPQARMTLGRLYNTVSDTGRPWPPGTRVGETREFTFDCVGVDRGGRRETVLRLSYLDYAGELLDAEQTAGGTDLDELAAEITSAHALLAMLDGYRVLQLLEGEHAGYDYFQRSLAPMLGFMQGASCPIHLIVTKWDLVRASAYGADFDERALFDRVVQSLMRFDHIRALVYGHSRDQIVRLIPVSAVGPQFAQLNADGTVVKRADGELRPSNVDVPLCAVLPDLFKQVETSLGHAVRRNVNAELLRQIRRNAGALIASVLARPAGVAMRTALQGALGADVGAASSTLFLEWVVGRSGHDGQLGEARDRLEAEAGQLQSVRVEVIEDFKRSVARLEAALPSSELSGRW
jgi:hypothetical protein